MSNAAIIVRARRAIEKVQSKGCFYKSDSVNPASFMIARCMPGLSVLLP
jgi:hypothetical protein